MHLKLGAIKKSCGMYASISSLLLKISLSGTFFHLVFKRFCHQLMTGTHTNKQCYSTTAPIKSLSNKLLPRYNLVACALIDKNLSSMHTQHPEALSHITVLFSPLLRSRSVHATYQKCGLGPMVWHHINGQETQFGDF